MSEAEIAMSFFIGIYCKAFARFVPNQLAPKILTAILVVLLGISGTALFWPQNKATISQRPEPPAVLVHYSTLMGQEFFDTAYKQMPTITKTSSPVFGGTVNHHLLAAPLDAQFFGGLAVQKPKRIILIGPDHLSRGHQPITVTAGIWRTPYGDIKTDSELVSRLATDKIAVIEEPPFDYEFSVGGLAPFVKRSLPQASIATIIIRSDATANQLDKLASALPRDKDTVVVASIDFSHYLPSRAAEFHDITNRAVIDSFDYASFDKLEIDSVPTLRVLLKYLEGRYAQHSELVASTDSAKITNEPDTQETTSYLNLYFTDGPPDKTSAVTSLYLGGNQNVKSLEDRFMRGFMKFDDGKTLPANLKKPNLAVGIVKTEDQTAYYLFPTINTGKERRLMTSGEERKFFRQNKLDSAIITIPN